jgi:hypothetical protein
VPGGGYTLGQYVVDGVGSIRRVPSTTHNDTEIKMSDTSRADWLFLALDEAGEKGLSSVQLQKVMFLLGARRKQDVGKGFYHFVPYSYGPFSVDIYTDADSLALRGAIAVDVSHGRSLRRYALTKDGQHRAASARKHVAKAGSEYLAEVVPWAQGLSFTDLLRAVYAAYPKMAVNSVFRD